MTGLWKRQPSASSQTLRASSASWAFATFALSPLAFAVSEFALELGDRLVQLARQSLAAGLLLGVRALPVVFVELAHRSLDLAQAILDGLDLVARHLADLVPAALDADASDSLALTRSVTESSFSASVSSSSFSARLASNSTLSFASISDFAA